MPISSDVRITNDCAERLLLLASDPRALDGLSAADRRELGGILKQINGALNVPLRDQIFPDTGPLRRELYPKHMEHFAAGRDYKERLFMAGNRIGKFLRTDTPIRTPSGWTTMGALTVGDQVFDETGTPCPVTGVYPQGFQKMYRVEFDQRVSLYAGADHQWTTITQHECQHPEYWTGRPRATDWRARIPAWAQRSPITTAQIAATLRVRGGRQSGYVSSGWVANHHIPVARPLQQATNPDLPIPPYCLGVWLGDGSGRGGTITASYDDAAHYQRLFRERGEDFATQPSRSTIKKGCAGFPLTRRTFTTRLRHLSLVKNKHIPAQYLRASCEQRLELLRGLIDTDGWVLPKGAVEFTNTNRALAEGVHELVSSLGMKARWTDGRSVLNGIDHGPCYDVTFRPDGLPVATLDRKVARLRPLTASRPTSRVVTAVDDCGVYAEMVCISVKTPNSLYLAGRDMIPTHNTYAGGYEFSCVSTGWYPPWWNGWRTTEPGSYLIGSKTTRLIKRITQYTLFGRTLRDERGKFYVSGTGMIPFGAIDMRSAIFNPAAAGTLSEIQVRYKDSAFEASLFEFASYDQGRALFEGTAQQGVWFDEEPDIELYSQALVRTMTTDGKVVTTFTPLDGMTEVVLSFMPAEFNPPPIDERDELNIMGEARNIDFH